MTRGELRRAARRARLRLRAHNEDRLPPFERWMCVADGVGRVGMWATRAEAFSQWERLGAGWELWRLTAEGWVRVRGAAARRGGRVGVAPLPLGARLGA